jgi:hypothetical protein
MGRRCILVLSSAISAVHYWKGQYHNQQQRGMLNCDPLHEIHDNFKKLSVVQQGIAVIFVLIIRGGLITAIVSPFMSQKEVIKPYLRLNPRLLSKIAQRKVLELAV